MADTVALSQRQDQHTISQSVSSGEIAQYDQIVILRDSIFAGLHPRLKLSSGLPPIASTTNASAFSSSHHPDTTVGVRETKVVNGGFPKTVQTAGPSAVQPLHAANSLPSHPSNAKFSVLDAPLARKPDSVAPLDGKTERLQIERDIESRLQQKKETSKQRVSESDALPDFDVSEDFFQALERVKHVAAAPPASEPRPRSASETPDEDTLYSSQVNESATDDSNEHPRKRKTRPCRFFYEGSCKKGDSCNYSHDPAFKHQLQAIGSLTKDADNPKSERPPQKHFQPQPDTNPPLPRASPTYSNREDGELVEDIPYSPSTQMPVEDVPSRHGIQQNYPSRDLSRPSIKSPPRGPRSQQDQQRNGHRSPSPVPGRIVRNHITSPIAPQPARVSPLAMAKLPRIERIRETADTSPKTARRTSGRQESGRQEGPSQMQAHSSRKRRREVDHNDATRNVSSRRAVESPRPYIKDEPVSPPPFGGDIVHAQGPAQHLRPQYQPVLSSPQNRERIINRPIQDSDQYVEEIGSRRIASPAPRRIVSGPNAPREVYREPSLRRIVSARYAESALLPREEFGYPAPVPGSPRTGRPTSQYTVEDQSPNYRAPSRAQQVVYTPSLRAMTPEVRTFSPHPQDRSPGIMGPPPRRVIMDHDGTRYLETVPRAETRVAAVQEPHYINNVPQLGDSPLNRHPSTRIEPSKLYQDEDYARGPESSALVSPRYADYPPPARPLSRMPVYEAVDEQRYHVPREVLRVIRYPDGRIEEQYEEVPRAREPIVRMTSIRPESSAMRMQSVRPEEPVQFVSPRERVERYHTTQPEQPQQYVDPHEDGRRYRSMRLEEQSQQPMQQSQQQHQQYIDLSRDAGQPTYAQEVREISRRPEGTGRYSVRPDYMDGPVAPVYHHYAGPPAMHHGARYATRELERDVVMHDMEEVERRPVYRM